jgi:transposase InsO family protein
MSAHDAAIRYMKRVVEVISRSGNKSAACATLGVHRSTYYRWKNTFDRGTPVGRRQGWVDQQLERRVIAEALAYPHLGPNQVSDRLGDGGLMVHPSRVWRILRRHGLNTAKLRRAVLEQHRTVADPHIVMARPPRPVRYLRAEAPGDLVQIDCFYVGSFKETRLGANKRVKGQVWQYTAIDVASSYLWVALASSPHNPDPAVASKLAHDIAADLTSWGWQWKQASTDNGNEFRADTFIATLAELGVTHRFIRAGRPQSNGKVEQVHAVMLNEFYQPNLGDYVQPSITGLRHDLAVYVHDYNHRRRNRGKWNQGRTPAQIIQPKPRIIQP